MVRTELWLESSAAARLGRGALSMELVSLEEEEEEEEFEDSSSWSIVPGGNDRWNSERGPKVMMIKGPFDR